ncbi:MAG: hypothetical protein K2N28_05625 [Muribaculaceae bacterium]|nr:hypothetical protein [Muribaculaceae bacterium]
MQLKRLFTILFLATVSAATVNAQEIASVDTIKVIENARNITISYTDSATVLTVDSPTTGNSFDRYTYTVSRLNDSKKPERLQSSDDMMFKLSFLNRNEPKTSARKIKRYFTGLRYIYWGWNFNYNYKSGIKNSYEFGCADLIGVDWLTSKYTTLGVGLGFGYNRVTTTNKALFCMDGDRLSTIAAPADADVDFARWDTWRIQLPLMFKQRLYKDFAIGVAAIVNFNVYSSATNRYHVEHTRITNMITGIKQRLLTADAMLTIGLSDAIGIYGKWSPFTTMQPSNGPAFRNFSIGVTINF